MKRMMAYSLAIVFTLATFAHLGSSLMLIDGWEGKVCAAYFKASGLDKSMYPAGQCWSDKVCVDDPSFYLACGLNNGVFTGEKHQCPPGMQFYIGANQMWEKTCVPADKCKTNKQCPNWLGQLTPGNQHVIDYHSSARYNASYSAEKAVAGGSLYYCSPRFDTADCGGVHWWMEFKLRPATIVSISFREGSYKKGGEFEFWGCLGAFRDNRCRGKFRIFGHGTAEELSMGAFENNESYNIYGLSSIKCPEYERAKGDFYWTISNFAFEEEVMTECQRQRESAPRPGGFAPSCDINGDFSPLQCGAGFCWCVYADGTKIANTKCDMASSLTKAQCVALRLKASSPVYEGFKPLQCGAGFCWCVYADGTKIPNTKFVMAVSTLTDAKCALYRAKVPTPIYEGVKPLQCAAGFCWCVYADGTKIPNTKCETAFSSLTDAECVLLRNKAPTPVYLGAKPLQCGVGFCWCVYADGTKIPGTKFAMAFSSLTDAKCALYREKVPTPIDTPVVVGVTKRQCACKMALKLSTSGSSSAYACDPYLQHNFLVCQDDGTFESKPCPIAGQSWNYMEKTCSDKMRKCRPLPATCL